MHRPSDHKFGGKTTVFLKFEKKWRGRCSFGKLRRLCESIFYGGIGIGVLDVSGVLNSKFYRSRFDVIFDFMVPVFCIRTDSK